MNDQQQQQQQYGDYSSEGYSNEAGYSYQQQYDESGQEYGYNYDYNYGYSEAMGQSDQGQATDETGYSIDDGSQSHGYGYYDDTGYYYDGQWYTYEGEGSWESQHPEEGNTAGQEYDYSGYNQQEEEIYPTGEESTHQPAVCMRFSLMKGQGEIRTLLASYDRWTRGSLQKNSLKSPRSARRQTSTSNGGS